MLLQFFDEGRARLLIVDGHFVVFDRAQNKLAKMKATLRSLLSTTSSAFFSSKLEGSLIMKMGTS